MRRAQSSFTVNLLFRKAMEPMTVTKPLPLEDVDAEPFWKAAQQHVLSLMRCADCDNFVHPPGPRCPTCGTGEGLQWVDFGNDVHGTVYSYVVVDRAMLRSFVDETPYVVALCDVDGAEGVHVAGNVLGCQADDVHIGDRVTMTWEDRAPGWSLPQWVLDPGVA
jgi:hypothetical protein